jgi:hypothetical protein
MVLLLVVKYLNFLTSDAIIVFSTFLVFWFSCTFYRKCMYCSCRMLVLLRVNYLKFLKDNSIILVFLHLDFVGFLVRSILSRCTACVNFLYFSSSSIGTSVLIGITSCTFSRNTGIFCFFYI